MSDLRVKHFGVCWAAICLTLSTTSGCFQHRDTVYTEYGKIRGKSAGTSVNGVSVFADMFRERGNTVARYGRLSPKIERYETLVWFPANKNCPSDEAVERLEEWLSNGYQRTLIYVGYDYAGEIDYYRRLTDRAEGEQKERAMRALAEAQMKEDARLYDDVSDDWRVAFASGQPVDDSCSWFDLEAVPREQSNVIEGPLAIDLRSGDAPTISTQLWLNPRETYVDSHPSRELETLVTVNNRPFAFRFRDEATDTNEYWEPENQLVFVTNGSFLTNYALVDSGNRQLAESLIDQVEPYSNVLFLESGENGIAVSDSDYEAHNQWSWITKKPLSYMVPHFLAWGVLFCFAFYPIFGRPRRTNSDRNRSFGDHIAAIARLSGRHLKLRAARSKVRKYLESNDGVPNKKHKATPSPGEKTTQ